ncbi:MAG: AgmX/PglI C-terminal domain-containing protein [Labilithrix sp.]|nr:AgmX/PglI C-terminal domain-containing protein [Labilithrix sp.]MBX3220821.1 AgmX/PglI C-terminal domain-containing protein [Labilithrix sp.]
MKTALLIAASLATVVGCAYRSPEMYRDDTTKVLETKQADIRTCYDEVLKGAPGAGGTVTVKFEVETEGGKIQNVVVDKPTTTAPDAVGECVRKNIEGLVINPPDKRLGQATYVYEFSIGASPGAAPKS